MSSTEGLVCTREDPDCGKRPRTEALQDVLHVIQLRTGFDELADVLDRALHCPGDLVDILRLHDSLQVILEDLGEVVCAG